VLDEPTLDWERTLEDSKINSITDLIEASDEIATRFGEKDIWWRGHAEARWKLQPRVFRGEIQEYSIEYENSLTGQFRRQAHVRSNNCPDSDAYEEWLFFMQHYRLPTRLLDWTESILIATYFAVSQSHSETGALWALDPALLNGSQLRAGIYDPTTKPTAGLFREAFRGYSQEPQLAYVTAVGIAEVDIRMLVQCAACTVHGTNRPIEEFAEKDEFLCKYEISAEGKARLKKSLDRLGISEHHLFPDLEHLSAHLRSATYGKYTAKPRT
jgi:FRG domain